MLLLLANCALLNLCQLYLCKLNANSLIADEDYCGHHGNRMDPHTHPNLVQMSRLIMTHMHQGGPKRSMIHIVRLSRESRACSRAGPEMTSESSESYTGLARTVVKG